MKHVREAAFHNFEATAARAGAAEAIITATSVGERCNALIDFYRRAKNEIVAHPNGWGIDPHEVRWAEVFTPIEAAMWHELRRVNLIFYPQLPVGKAFVDFGDPFRKIAIECDGKEWHLDRLKDRERDRLLAERGWKVFRISGADCLKEGLDGDEDTWPTPIHAFVARIAAEISNKEAA